MAEIPLSPMERLLKKAGAVRVGEDAKAKLSKVLEDHALQIGARATLLAKHAGRRTVRADDIALAIKESTMKK